MYLEPTKYDLGGRTFYIHIFGGWRSLHVLGELQKVLTPVLGGIAEAVSGGIKTEEDMNKVKDSSLQDAFMNMDLTSVGEALKKATYHLDGKELERLGKLLLTGHPTILYVNSENGESPDPVTEVFLDEFTKGHPEYFFKLMYKVVEVNYQDFFNSLKGVFGEAALLSRQENNA